MFKRLLLMICLLFVEQTIFGVHAYIEQFVEGIGKSRPWLSVIVRFDDKPNQAEYDAYFQYLNSSLQPLVVGTDKRSNEILFKLKEKSLSRSECQEMVNKTNSHFDPNVAKKADERPVFAEELSIPYATLVSVQGRHQIIFSEYVADIFVNKFFRFLGNLLYPTYSPTVSDSMLISSVFQLKRQDPRYDETKKLWLAEKFLFTVRSEFSATQLKVFVDQTNLHFNPAYKTAEERSVIAKIAAEELAKKRMDDEKIRNQALRDKAQKEQEQKIKEAMFVKRKIIERNPTPLELQDMLNEAIAKDSSLEVLFAVEAGAIVNVANINQSPLLKAVLLKKQNAVKKLIELGAQPDLVYLGNPIVFWVIKNGELEIATALIKAGGKFDGIIDGAQDVFTYVAIQFDKLDLLEAMAAKGYDVKGNFTNTNLQNNAWYLAIINNKVNLIGCFLGWGGKIQNKYSLLQAADPNQIFTLADGSTFTPLLLSIKYFQEHSKQPHVGHGNMGTLLAYGKNIDPNQQAKPDGKTWQSPLSYMLSTHSTISDALIKSGASLTEAIELFIKNGGDKNTVFKSGTGWMTLLGWVVDYQDMEAVKVLLNKHVDINQLINPYPVVTSKGQLEHYKKNGDPFKDLRGPHTPLLSAMKTNKWKMAEFLLENGAKL